MMKRTITIALLFTCFLTEAAAQQSYTRLHRDLFDEATFFFMDEDYESALYIFEELYPIDTSYNVINYFIGASMINIRGKENGAFPYLKKAVDGDVKEAFYWLGRAYHIRMEFDKAIDYYQRYMHFPSREIPDEEVKRHIDMSLLAKEMVAKPVDVELENLGPGINTMYSEYVPLVSADQTEIYFTSRRPDGTGEAMDPFGNYYEDIYYSQKVNGSWAPAVNVGPPLNTETHDATVSLTSSGNEMIIYRTNKNLTGGDLYLSTHSKTGWSPPVKFTENINSKYQEASAIISPDGETMYLSSNRPGGYGGRDLYRARRLPNGEWSLPENLGPTINTPYDEDAPFIHEDGTTLYFSSNGLPTMGGYDIFESKLDDSGFWSIPRNMGYPLNTVKDDIYFVMSPDGKSGYYSSDMPGGYGRQDIYRIDILYDKTNVVIVKGKTVDLLSQQPIKARITVIDPRSREIHGIYLSNSTTGQFILILQPDHNYKVLIEANGYQDMSRQVRFTNQRDVKLQEVKKTFELLKLGDQ